MRNCEAPRLPALRRVRPVEGQRQRPQGGRGAIVARAMRTLPATCFGARPWTVAQPREVVEAGRLSPRPTSTRRRPAGSIGRNGGPERGPPAALRRARRACPPRPGKVRSASHGGRPPAICIHPRSRWSDPRGCGGLSVLALDRLAQPAMSSLHGQDGRSRRPGLEPFFPVCRAHPLFQPSFRSLSVGLTKDSRAHRGRHSERRSTWRTSWQLLYGRSEGCLPPLMELSPTRRRHQQGPDRWDDDVLRDHAIVL